MIPKFPSFSIACMLISLLFVSCAPVAPMLQPSTSVPLEVTHASSTASSTPIPTATPVQPTPTPTVTAVPPTATSITTPTVSPDIINISNPQKYSVIYKIIIRNGGFTPNDFRLYLPVPVEWDAQKEVKVVQVSPDPKSQAIEKNSGNAMVYWQHFDGSPKKNTTATYLLNFDLIAYETRTNIDSAILRPYDKNTDDYQRYTRGERFIETGNQEIVALAHQIAADETNPYLLAKKFYDYVIDHAHYRLLNRGLNGAYELVKNGYGECGDYAALFIALCRTKGIPARPVVGYWAISGKEQTHVWAEFYLENIGWIPVDPTIGQQNATKRAYYFGNMDNERIILSKGYNINLIPGGPNGFIAPLLQAPLWWYWGSGDGNSMSMDRSWTVAKE